MWLLSYFELFLFVFAFLKWWSCLQQQQKKGLAPPRITSACMLMTFFWSHLSRRCDERLLSAFGRTIFPQWSERMKPFIFRKVNFAPHLIRQFVIPNIFLWMFQANMRKSGLQEKPNWQMKEIKRQLVSSFVFWLTFRQSMTEALSRFVVILRRCFNFGGTQLFRANCWM